MAGNYTVIRRFADNYFSVTQLKHKKPEGRPAISQKDLDEAFGMTSEEIPPEQKLKESLVRSRSRIFEISMCNDWELFVTFTIDQLKYNRYDLDKYYKDFARFIRYMREKYGLDIKYLLIPETHKDGAWHMHGFISGLPLEHLTEFSLKDKLPKGIRKELKKGRRVFDWYEYGRRFGFCDLELIQNKEACCKYIVKYITKDLDRSVKEANAKVYYCSQGLKRAEIIYVGNDEELIAFPNCSNVWLERKDYFTFAEALEYSTVQYFDSFISAGLDDESIEKILSA